MLRCVIGACMCCGVPVLPLPLHAQAKLEVEVRSEKGFEVLGGDGAWHFTPIVHSDAGAATLTLGGLPTGARAVRYLWYTAPCGMRPYGCPVYVRVAALGGAESGEREALPLGPFLQSLV